MARLVIHEATGPAVVTIGGERKEICLCGLSKTMPLCDDAHKLTLAEEKDTVYVYENGKGYAIGRSKKEGCCGGNCGCGPEGEKSDHSHGEGGGCGCGH